MDRLDNPYRPGAGTAPPALIGRDELIDGFGVTVRRALSGRPGKSYMAIGLRGVGKTVLLNRFAEIADQEGMEVAFIEAPETGDFRTILAIRLRKVLLSMRTSPARRAVNKALGVLRSFSYQLPDGSSLQIGVDAIEGLGDSGVLSEDLTDLLEAAGEAAREASTGFVLAVDEVQYLAAEELAAIISAIHRTTQRDLPVILVGAGLPQLPGLVGDAKSYAERLFDFPEVGSLSPEDAAAALLIPAHELGVEFDDNAIELVIEESHGYPYFIQEWGSHAWNGSTESPITEGDIRSIQPSVIDQLDRNFFKVRFDRLTPKESEYLKAMAELGPGPHRSGDIATRLRVKVESVGPRRSQLIGKGMIYSPAHGDTAFTVPLFDEYLNRTMHPLDY